jgi:hypothetical protein
VTAKTPGRPKGTRVTTCACGRRVAGPLGKFIKCPDCGKRVKICPRKTKGKAKAVFLRPGKPKR